METQKQHNEFNLNMDAFSDGQMASKIWLCEELERATKTINELWIFGSWYGTLAFLLLSRGRLQVNTIRLFDLDPKAMEIAHKVLNHWILNKKPQIEFHIADCNNLQQFLQKPDAVINTSTEHFADDRWWQFVPENCLIVLQSTNMAHPEHIRPTATMQEMEKRFQPLSQRLYLGQKNFSYPNFEFSRFMLIARK